MLNGDHMFRLTNPPSGETQSGNLPAEPQGLKHSFSTAFHTRVLQSAALRDIIRYEHGMELCPAAALILLKHTSSETNLSCPHDYQVWTT